MRVPGERSGEWSMLLAVTPSLGLSAASLEQHRLLGSATLVTSDNRLRPHKPQTLEVALRCTQEVTQGHVLKKRVPVQTTCFAPQSLLSPETNLGVPRPIHFL